MGVAWIAMSLLAAWREMFADRTALPFFEVVQRRGLTLAQLEAGAGIASLARAVRRCALCAGKGECREELAADPAAQPRDCPNAAFLRRRFDDHVR